MYVFIYLLCHLCVTLHVNLHEYIKFCSVPLNLRVGLKCARSETYKNERFDENVFDQEQKHSFPDTLPINVRRPIRTFSKKKKKKKRIII